jgi:hypothetical protein
LTALVDVCSPLMSNTIFAKAVQPTQGALDDPTPSARPFLQLDATPCDPCCDSRRNHQFNRAKVGIVVEEIVALDAALDVMQNR